jgi:hypothetical protein
MHLDDGFHHLPVALRLRQCLVILCLVGTIRVFFFHQLVLCSFGATVVFTPLLLLFLAPPSPTRLTDVAADESPGWNRGFSVTMLISQTSAVG